MSCSNPQAQIGSRFSSGSLTAHPTILFDSTGKALSPMDSGCDWETSVDPQDKIPSKTSTSDQNHRNPKAATHAGPLNERIFSRPCDHVLYIELDNLINLFQGSGREVMEGLRGEGSPHDGKIWNSTEDYNAEKLEADLIMAHEWIGPSRIAPRITLQDPMARKAIRSELFGIFEEEAKGTPTGKFYRLDSLTGRPAR